MITVVCGPPCAGKTTHVQQHARPGDLVIDSDLIARELGSDRDHFHRPELKPRLHAEWRRRVDAAPTHVGDVWIVRALPRALVDVPLTVPYTIVELWPPDAVLMARAAARRHGDRHQRNVRSWLQRHAKHRPANEGTAP